MCGFTGFCALTQKSPLTQEAAHQILTNMHQEIIHRGPDDAGTWLSQDASVGIANRRLAIIDVSPAGHQPMIDRDGTIIVSYNGEIYNHKNVRTELEKRGYIFTSQCDTETLVYAYKEWGIDCLKKIEGMFAGVIYDTRTRDLYIFRDRIGIKPAYFSVQNNIISFASEIKALWKFPHNTRTISHQALYHYLTFMVTPAPYTMFEQVYKLPAGFYLKIDAHKRLSFTEWYTPVTIISEHDKKDFAHEDFCVEHIKSLLTQSVQEQMVSDVPFGTFLSGGIDSSLNTALMSQAIGKVKTFTVAFSDGPEYDELKWARLVAKYYDTDHHEIIISEKDAFEFYKNMTYYLDEPLADCVCIPFYFVAKLARESGVTVAQIGEGADELFFGYDTYARTYNFYKNFWQPTQNIPRFAKHIANTCAHTIAPRKINRLEMISNWANNKPLFWGGALAFGEEHKKEILHTCPQTNKYDPIIAQIYPELRQEEDSSAIIDYHLGQLKKHKPDATFEQQMLYIELKQRLPELLLMRADKMTMATSIEGRVPFLDHKLVEFMFHVPIDLKFKHQTTKYLLKKAALGILPNEIINRKKVGFAAPTARWFAAGKYFPAYFNTLHTSSHIFNKKTDNIGAYFSEHESSLAVKNWVLQSVRSVL